MKKSFKALSGIFLIVLVTLIGSFSAAYIVKSIIKDKQIAIVDSRLKALSYKIIVYDNILTKQVLLATSQSLADDNKNIEIYKQAYNETKHELDRLLKEDAVDLLNKSFLSQEDKNIGLAYMNKIDEAIMSKEKREAIIFNLNDEKKPGEAHDLIVGSEYKKQENALLKYHTQWAALEQEQLEEANKSVDTKFHILYFIFIGTALINILLALGTLVNLKKCIINSLSYTLAQGE